jgi:hypothetical protein
MMGLSQGALISRLQWPRLATGKIIRLTNTNQRGMSRAIRWLEDTDRSRGFKPALSDLPDSQKEIIGTVVMLSIK